MGAGNRRNNEGDYFPEWLREIAIELVNPVPKLQEVLAPVKTAEVRHMMKQLNISWTTTTGTAEVRNIVRSGVALNADTGQLLYAYGFGWGGEFKDYKGFHGRTIAHTVSWGSPEVTARVITLEDLGEVPATFFDTDTRGGDPQLLQTVLLDEISFRKNLLPIEPVVWPPVQDGPFQGNVTTILIVDRDGKGRDIESVVSENAAMNKTGKEVVTRMRFKPFLVNRTPVQAMSQFTLPFKTSRPAGAEAFDSAETYFERGRQVGFPAAGSGAPYVLHAEFQFKKSGGNLETGHYEDTWLSDDQWLRRAEVDNDFCARSRQGDKRYRDSEALRPAYCAWC